jgi:hypothetical protein
MNNKALEEAIGNKELKGIVEEKGSLFKTITITDSKELVRFLSNGGEMKIFTEETKRTFSRIK